MIDRTGQVWEDEGAGCLMYLVVESRDGKLLEHHCLLLHSTLTGYSAGECITEYEREETTWEKTNRRRLL